MPRRRRVMISSNLSPNLTPLLDVVLQLITFFMMLVHFGSRLEGLPKKVHLPLAPAALPGSDLTFDRLSVVLDARGQILVDGHALDARAADAWLAAQAQARRAGRDLSRQTAPVVELPTIVIIWADRATPYGSVRQTLAQAQDKGFAHFSLVVDRGRTQ
jgi:biopolymer transport protein ExbD